ncbi:hypothetical protein ACQY0O_006192 [Thecaphora frezii]
MQAPSTSTPGRDKGKARAVEPYESQRNASPPAAAAVCGSPGLRCTQDAPGLEDDNASRTSRKGKGRMMSITENVARSPQGFMPHRAPSGSRAESSTPPTTDSASARQAQSNGLGRPDLGEPFATMFDPEASGHVGDPTRRVRSTPSGSTPDLRQGQQAPGPARGTSGKRTFADVSVSPQQSPVATSMSLEPRREAERSPVSLNRSFGISTISAYQAREPTGLASGSSSGSIAAGSSTHTRVPGTSQLRHRDSNKRRRSEGSSSYDGHEVADAAGREHGHPERGALAGHDSVDDLRALIEVQSRLLDSSSETTAGSIASRASLASVGDAAADASFGERSGEARAPGVMRSDAAADRVQARFPPAEGGDSAPRHEEGGLNPGTFADTLRTTGGEPRTPTSRSEHVDRVRMVSGAFSDRPRRSLLQNASTDPMSPRIARMQSFLDDERSTRIVSADTERGREESNRGVRSLRDGRISATLRSDMAGEGPTASAFRRNQVLSAQLAELRSRVDSTAVELAHWRARSQELRHRLTSNVLSSDAARGGASRTLNAGTSSNELPPLRSPLSGRDAAFDASRMTRGEHSRGEGSTPDSHPTDRRIGSISASGRVRGPTFRENEIWLGLDRGTSSHTVRDTAASTARPRDGPTGQFASQAQSRVAASSDEEAYDRPGYRQLAQLAPLDTLTTASDSNSRPEDSSWLSAPRLPDLRARSPLSVPFVASAAGSEESDWHEPGTDRPEASTGSSSSATQNRPYHRLSTEATELSPARSGLRPLTLSARMLRSEGTRRPANFTASPLASLDDEDSRQENASTVSAELGRGSMRALNDTNMLAAGQAGRRWSPYDAVPPHSQDRGLRRSARELQDSRPLFYHTGFLDMRAYVTSSAETTFADAREGDDLGPRGWVSTPSDGTGRTAIGRRASTEAILLEQIARRRARRLETSAHGTQEHRRSEADRGRSPMSVPYRQGIGRLEPYGEVEPPRGSGLRRPHDSPTSAASASSVFARQQTSTPHLGRDEFSLRLRRRAEWLTSQNSTPFVANRHEARTDPEPNRYERAETRRFAATQASDTAGDHAGASRTFRRVPEGLWAREQADHDQRQDGRPYERSDTGATHPRSGREPAESPFDYLSRLLRQEDPLPVGVFARDVGVSAWRPGESSRAPNSLEDWFSDDHHGPWTSTSRIESFLRLISADGFSLASDPANYLTDEEWEVSNTYEDLLLLSSRVGDAVPKNVPPHIVACFATCQYSQWAGGSCDGPAAPAVVVGKGKQKVNDGATVCAAETDASRDTNCAICLDEYDDSDWIMSVPGCNHAFHASCLKTWFESARTCPFCRADAGKAWAEKKRNAEAKLPEVRL